MARKFKIEIECSITNGYDGHGIDSIKMVEEVPDREVSYQNVSMDSRGEKELQKALMDWLQREALRTKAAEDHDNLWSEIVTLSEGHSRTDDTETDLMTLAQALVELKKVQG